MAATLAREPVNMRSRRWEDPLPHPLPGRVRVLAGERRWQFHPAGAGLEIAAMLLADALQVPGEVWLHYGGQHRHAALVALAAPHDDLVRPEIHVLDAEAAALKEPEPGPIEKKCHDSRRAFEPAQYGTHFVPGQDNGQALRALGTDDLVHAGERLSGCARSIRT